MEIKKCKDLGASTPQIFYCECCNYETITKHHYLKHLETTKHNRKILESSSKINEIPKQREPVPLPTTKNTQYSCKTCSRNFLTTSGLWKHNKKCEPVNSTETREPGKSTAVAGGAIDNQQIFLDLMRHNQEMQNLWIEQTKELHDKMVEKMEKIATTNQITNHNSNNQTINSNNKQFNLNFFLHETCKDALNFSEFITSITQNLKLEDLEETGRLGYVDGLSRIFVNALKNTELERRPLHCTDIKRETLYIKEEDKWEKENHEKDTLKNAIEFVAKKNMSQINEWKDQNPECLTNINSDESAVLNKLYMTTIGGFNQEEDDKMKTKIVRNVLSEVVVDKGIVCNIDYNVVV